ncbi:hypothetical protein LP420_20960 [Massilia sp. B-10]|nr:hypothetical protein LP420_20960 [Massilia sp. B-10]
MEIEAIRNRVRASAARSRQVGGADEALAELLLVGDFAVPDGQHRQAGQGAGRVGDHGRQFRVQGLA